VTPLPRWLSLRGTTADYAADERGLHRAIEEAVDAAARPIST
jgi:hypothetical protein